MIEFVLNLLKWIGCSFIVAWMGAALYMGIWMDSRKFPFATKHDHSPIDLNVTDSFKRMIAEIIKETKGQ